MSIVSLIIMILLISLLILVHEAGHFLAARAFGIKVDKFGFGLPIGPTLFKTKIGDVEIPVHAFLLGGYVSFPDDDKDCELPEDSPDRFMNKPLWQRAVVIVAGVLANVICAFLLVFFVASYTKQLPSGNFEVYVSEINAPKGSSVWSSGLKKGDRILLANGCEINNFYAFTTIAKNSAKNNGTISQKIADENYRLLKKLNPAFEKDEIIPEGIPVRLLRNPVSETYTLDKYAAKGAKYFKKEGYKIDENIKLLEPEVTDKHVYNSNGKYSLYQIAQALSDGKHPINITVLRNGEKINLNPVYPDENGIIGIGMSMKPTAMEIKSAADVVTKGSKYLTENTYLMIYSLGQLFTGNIPLKDMHGIIAITKIGGDMIEKSGKASGILLTALISMNLAILNILPIPALDGGHLLFMIIEKITGKPVDEKVIERISSAFFTLLILLMVFVVFNDIIYLIKK